jgi:cell division protein FtsL
MVYSWQHFSSIEYGYHIETEKAQLQHLQEENHQLGLTEAQLTRSERIDRLAHQIGMQSPQPGQVVSAPAMMDTDPNSPVLASVTIPMLPANR